MAAVLVAVGVESAPSPRLPTRSRSAADGRIADLDPISLRPVVGDRALGLSHVELADADYFARPPLQAVLRLRVPLRLNGPARLRPEIRLGLGAADS